MLIVEISGTVRDQINIELFIIAEIVKRSKNQSLSVSK